MEGMTSRRRQSSQSVDETLWLGQADTSEDRGGHLRMRDTAAKTGYGYGCKVTTGEADPGQDEAQRSRLSKRPSG